MPQTELAGGGLLGLVVIFFILYQISQRGADPEPETTADIVREPGEPVFLFPDSMSSATGIAAWWRRRFLHRKMYPAECLFDYEDEGTVLITLPMPRRVTRLDLEFDTDGPFPMRNVVIETVGDHAQPEWTGKWCRRRGKHYLRLDFDGATPLATIRLTPAVTGKEGEFRMWLMKNGNPDAAYLEAADRADREGHRESHLSNLKAYQELCPQNPVPALQLAFFYRMTEEYEKSEIEALRGIALNRAEPGVNACREMADLREWGLSNERLAKLRQEAAAWELEGHHGLVTLSDVRHFLAGPGHFLRERHVSAILVRRRAAARNFRSLNLPLVTGNGGLLHTEARVRRLDGTVDKISDDRFTVGSAEDDNPFIAVARRSTGTWILPDLAPGDVVEFTCDKVTLGHERPFMSANVGDPSCPTLHGQVTCIAPPDWDVVCAVRNTDPGHVTGLDPATGWTRFSLERERLLPRRSHSDPYQRTGLNPVVGFARRADGWDETGRLLLGEFYDAVEAAQKIPAQLASSFAEASTTTAKLARAFYWVRDHIKYASVASHHDVLMSPERATIVLESGMGDCKDVSYLLALVCRDLDIPWEFVLMSTENGAIIEDLPADQFDHVILRALVDDQWLYLDAAGSGGVFGAPPSMGQGLSVLCGRDPFALATVPEAPADYTRIAIRQIVAGVQDDWLHGSIDVRLEGYTARFLDEIWKHHSLTAVDPDRAADDTVWALLPQFCVDRIERRQDTTDSDTLHFEAQGRHAQLVWLDGKRIASFGFTAPGLFVDQNVKRRFRERFYFPYRMLVSYELEIAEQLQEQLRGVSFVPELEWPMCAIRETRGLPGAAVVLRREIELGQRKIDGDDLALLPELLNRLGAATRVVVALTAVDEAPG